ncbi:hypothetical protein MP228_002263 [Amoeboaphelidium protococcarum]|nr:hypothetical protein MP228_002263 [Amoeboaphelidium protococcarum]
MFLVINAGMMHVNKNPPVPVVDLTRRLSRRGLVVSVPRYHSTKLCSCCRHGCKIGKGWFLYRRVKKGRRRVPKQSHPVLCCFDASSSFLHVSSSCPDRQQKQVESSLAFAQIAKSKAYLICISGCQRNLKHATDGSIFCGEQRTP